MTKKITNASGIEELADELLKRLPNNAIRITTSYSSSPILGFKILSLGTGNLLFQPSKPGAIFVTVTNAELIAMGAAAFYDWNVECRNITPGTGMEVLIYTT